jgi:hypothetical protein
MRGLSVIQPYATLLAIAAKRFETRSWPTSYRGPIAIHASQGFPRKFQALIDREPFLSVLRPYLDDQYSLPRGAILATATLVNCHAVEILTLSDQERAFGDYSPGRFAWEFVDVVRLNEPAPCKGMLGLWAVPEHVRRRIRAKAP